MIHRSIRSIFLLLVLTSNYMMMASMSGKWEPVDGSMMTEWGRNISPESAWREYPRPQMIREQWINLNGLWRYAVTKESAPVPDDGDGEILVPFCVESPLSGVGHLLEPDEALWYWRNFDAKLPEGKRMLLHFEAVDYATEVWVNDCHVGSHLGGNLPFSFDITKAMKPGSNSLRVRVQDATDSVGSFQLHGKQHLENKGIFYTRVSGIWQTVWLEPVPQSYIRRVSINTEMDGRICIQVEPEGAVLSSARLKAFISLNGRKVAVSEGGTELVLSLDDPRLWSPDDPVLYDLSLQLSDDSGVIIDTVESYFGIREVGKRMGEDGQLVFTLNGCDIFHWGPLDQGWWPDGLLTPPSEDAMAFEIRFLKQAGFNMIRKHVKVEPRRYYALCDRIGMLVWQDHVPGGQSPKWKRLIIRRDKDGNPVVGPGLATSEDSLDAEWPGEAHQQFMQELSGMVDHLHNHPSIVVWTPFNERWAQHKTMEVGQWISEYDSSRLINIASGGNFFPVGDIADEHDYPDPNFPLESAEFDGFIKVVGEFGGHGYPVEGHLWDPDKRNWGYGGLPDSAEEYRERYVRTANKLGELKGRGIAAGVYTQTSDVEGEINGLLTYDRAVQKLSAEVLKKIHNEAGLTCP